MKVRINFIFKYLFLLACAILIIYFLPKSPANAEFYERSYTGGAAVSGRGEYWFDDMIAGSEYLCAQEGATFFTEGTTYMKLSAFWSNKYFTFSSKENKEGNQFYELYLDRRVQNLNDYTKGKLNDVRQCYNCRFI